MSSAATETPVSRADSETTAQRARRERILKATMELASGGGYDAVQMRAVAERSEVALGTLYRYFPSKVHLLVSAMASELDVMRTRLQRRGVPGDSPLERVIWVLERSTRSLQKDPQLTEAMVRAMMAADASVAHEATSVRNLMGGLILKAMRGDDEPTDEDRARAAIVQDVWFARQIAWLGGRISTVDVWDDIDRAVRLILVGTH